MARSRRKPVNLTDRKIWELRADPAGGECIQSDLQVPAFGVRVRPNPRHWPTYILMKRLPDGAMRRITLGPVPEHHPATVGEITLTAARELARATIAALGQGVDVNAQKRAERERRRGPRARRAEPIEDPPSGCCADEIGAAFAPDSFGATAELYIAQECKGRLARGAEIESIIRRRLLPAWGIRPLGELRRRDLTKLLDPIVTAGRSQAAHKLREVALRIVNWAVDRGDIEINYLASPSRRKGGQGGLTRTRRTRVLTPDEIRAIWAACGIVTPTLFGDIVRALFLTGQRRDDVAGMEERELDLDQALWIIPTARYKTEIDHVVPLPASAVELLRGLPRIDNFYVFSTEPGTRFSGFSKAMEELRTLSGLADWRLHDIRRTVRTSMSPLKNAAGQRVGADIAERVIGHVVGGVRGIYDR